MWRLVNRNVHSLRYCYALIVDTSDLGACRNVNCANGGTCSAETVHVWKDIEEIGALN